MRFEPPRDEADRAWLEDLWRREWGGEAMVTRGRIRPLGELEALIAWLGRDRAGAATYGLAGQACELVSLKATVQGRGVASGRWLSLLSTPWPLEICPSTIATPSRSRP